MLNVVNREKLGTRAAKKLRLQGMIPVSIQGIGKPNLDAAINEDEFLTLRRAHEHVFDLTYADGKEDTALVRELQWDVIRERIIHVEFRRIVRGQKTELVVDIRFEGQPKGGVTNQLVSQVTILALPRNIPDGLEVDMEGLEPGEAVHASDIELPEGVELVTEDETVLATVTIPRGIEETPVGEEGLAEGEEAPEGEDAAAASEDAPPEAPAGEKTD